MLGFGLFGPLRAAKRAARLSRPWWVVLSCRRSSQRDEWCAIRPIIAQRIDVQNSLTEAVFSVPVKGFCPGAWRATVRQLRYQGRSGECTERARSRSSSVRFLGMLLSAFLVPFTTSVLVGALLESDVGTVQLVPSQDCSFTGVDSQELSDGRGRFLPASRSHQLYDAEACECEIIEGRTLGPKMAEFGAKSATFCVWQTNGYSLSRNNILGEL